MNTKTFAQLSRNILMDGVAKKLLYWGFSPKGEVLEMPQKISGGYIFRGEPGDDPNVPVLWEALNNAIQKKGIEVVVEEAAYTWFNRLMALRIMAKNGYEPSLLQNAEGLEHTPLLLQRARQGHYDFLKPAEQQRLKNIITDYTKDQEAFALLLVGYCHSNKMLNTVFGKLDDYTELLLPDNMLQDSGFLHLLNTTDAISDEEYKQVELIGWLYQFYISEKKDDVFASFKKGKKAEAKDIPAATQIFTPNWIVKYMVENTAGKIWLDKNPDSPIKEQMKYLVSSDEGQVSSDENHSPLITTIEDLTLLDPAVGSGHILVEGFDLLYQMYMEEYYTPEEAVESILKNNLYGLDLDDRAAQLANFAILLKAAIKYRDVFAKGWMPNVYAMPESRDFSTQDLKDFLGEEGKDYLEELDTALRLMKQAKNLGSTMKLSLSEDAYAYIQDRYQSLQKEEYLDLNLKSILQGLQTYIPILLILTKKFAAVVANPPYMGQKSMNADLKNYVNANYPLSKSDLFAVFMEVCLDLNIPNGFMGMINQHSWMFLSSYEKLRSHILDNYGIVNMLHLGPRTFEELSGEVVQSTAFVLENGKGIEKATYYRLVDYKNVNEKENNFLQRTNEFKNISQTNFSNIPGSPIAYWVSQREQNKYASGKYISSVAFPRKGIDTGENKRFLRFWTEVSIDKSSFFKANKEDKWYPYNKGGGFRKWYGLREYLVEWKDNGQKIKERLNWKQKKPTIRNAQFHLQEGFTWSTISSEGLSSRYTPKGCMFDNGGCTLFADNDLNYLGALLNSNVAKRYLEFLAPTINFQPGDIGHILFEPPNNELENIDEIVSKLIALSKEDWDSRETSWDFEQSPLLGISDKGLGIRDEKGLSLATYSSSLKEAYQAWEKEVTQDFFQLHANEEELNRIFIDIYGLQDELTPDVALKDITILQEELDRKQLEKDEVVLREKGLGVRSDKGLGNRDENLSLIPENYSLPIDKAEVISQFISYAIGVFMGRYRLDKPGLHIAHPNPTAEELTSYTFNGNEVSIDEDAILPLIGTQSNFPDDALPRFYDFLDIIWGGETRTENINFIQECLDKDLERFLVRDFYKYHCKMYKKKPIYWLFASPKGAFQVLVYMHRMNAFTVEKIRANYLLEHLKKLRSEEQMLSDRASSLNTQEARRLDQVRKDIAECEAYDMELKEVADAQITFDLDDGVTVNYDKFKSVVAKI